MFSGLKYILATVLITLLNLTACGTSEEKPVPEAGIQSIEVNPQTKERQLIYLSDVYEVKDIYKSMQGPSTTTQLKLTDDEKPELMWITGFSAEMVEPDGETKMSQEFMCHSNLDIDTRMHKQIFKTYLNPLNDRLFTLSQGQFEVEFPEGFGLPILTLEELNLTTQVLNLNHENPDIKTRHKIKLRFIRDSDLEEPMVPLMRVYSMGLKRVEKSYNVNINKETGSREDERFGCLVGEDAGIQHMESSSGHKSKYTGHWVVEPGEEINSTLVTNVMNLPYDTKIHYIAVHLHPFAESLELKDLTTGETVFKSNVRNYVDKIGLDYVDYFSSSEGLPIYKEHEYQLISRYNNTSGERSDSMAVMYIYAEDHAFKKPTPETITKIQDMDFSNQ